MAPLLALSVHDLDVHPQTRIYLLRLLAGAATAPFVKFKQCRYCKKTSTANDDASLSVLAVQISGENTAGQGQDIKTGPRICDDLQLTLLVLNYGSDDAAIRGFGTMQSQT